VEAPAAGFGRASRRLNCAFLTIRPRPLTGFVDLDLRIDRFSDHILRQRKLDGGDGVGPTLTEIVSQGLEEALR
jgi:hypothetical protein